MPTFMLMVSCDACTMVACLSLQCAFTSPSQLQLMERVLRKVDDALQPQPQLQASGSATILPADEQVAATSEAAMRSLLVGTPCLLGHAPIV